MSALLDRTGKIDPFRKAASESFCKSYAQWLKPGPAGERQIFADCAVGSVALLGVIGAANPPTDNDGDRAIVEIRWSAKRILLTPNHPPSLLEENHLAYSLFVLWRKPGTKTDAGKGISSAHCPGCGAPESNSESNACDFCGIVLNDGSHGWILVDIQDRNSPGGARLLEMLQTGSRLR